MEYRYLAQQLFALTGNIYMGIFVVSTLVFFSLLYIIGEHKQKIWVVYSLYAALFLAVSTFVSAILLGNNNPYDSKFSQQQVSTVTYFIYGSYALFALIIGSVGISYFRFNK